MKKLIMTLGMLLATIVLSGNAAQAETVAVKKTIVVADASKDQLLNKVSTWASMYSRSYNVDAKAGVVTASGEITYPSPSVDRIQYTILFEMKNKVQGNRNTVTFEKVMLKSPTQYLQESNETVAGETSPIRSKKDAAAADKVLANVANNLEAYLLGKSAEACPLAKCPDCAVLCPTSEEMKEHMKTHEH